MPCAYLFEGTKAVGVVWNMNLPARLTLPMQPGALQAADLMGTSLPVAAEKDSLVVQLPAERPTYLYCDTGNYAALEKALAGAQMTDVEPVAVTAQRTADGVQVTVASRSSAPKTASWKCCRP